MIATVLKKEMIRESPTPSHVLLTYEETHVRLYPSFARHGVLH